MLDQEVGRVNPRIRSQASTVPLLPVFRSTKPRFAVLCWHITPALHAAGLSARSGKAIFFNWVHFAAPAMASITQRTSGLVQRRTEAIRSAAADKERESGAEEDEARRGEEEDDDKGDSKETRLTLMEEVLLLGLKDREVWCCFRALRPSVTFLQPPLASTVYSDQDIEPTSANLVEWYHVQMT